jgi:hypothetical protein
VTTALYVRPETAPPVSVLLDRCDRCHVAAALWTVQTPAGEMLLCGHHMNEHSAAITRAGYDFTSRNEFAAAA